MREAHYEFSPELKETVKRQQAHRCAWCDQPSRLYIHHQISVCDARQNNIDPSYISSRHNAVGLCDRDHKFFDELYKEKKVTFAHYLMQEGKEYYLPSFIPKQLVA